MRLLYFVFGAILGSAANALIDRLPKNISWTKGRSKCDACKHKLNWDDLIPVVSYLRLWGKCRYCNSPIPIRNLLVELLIGTGFVLICSLGGLGYPEKFELAGILWVTTIVAVMDWETKLVSELMVAIWGGLAVLWGLGNLGWLSSFGGLAAGVLMIGGIWAVSRGRAMGLGDVEIAAAMGWWLGWPNLLIALWAGFVSGAIVGMYKLMNKQAKLKSEIAFGPFLVLGAWIAYIWGDKIWNLWRVI